MEEASKYIAGISAAGLLALFWSFVKAKRTLKEELVDPEIKVLKEEMATMKADIASLKNNDKELSNKVDQQFESMKVTLSATNQSIAKMQGTLDLLVKQFVK